MNSDNKKNKKINAKLHRGRINNLIKNSVKLFVLCGLLLIIISCSSQKPAFKEIPIERDGKIIAVVKAEVARTSEERSLGLMHRKKLPDGEGMLFVFEKDDVLSFWMKNT